MIDGLASKKGKVAGNWVLSRDDDGECNGSSRWGDFFYILMGFDESSIWVCIGIKSEFPDKCFWNFDCLNFRRSFKLLLFL